MAAKPVPAPRLAGGLQRSLYMWKWRVFGVGLGTRQRLYEQFAFFLAQKIPVATMLQTMIAVLELRKRPLRWLLEAWFSLRSMQIWDAMARYVPSIDVVAISAGSARGDLSRGFRQAFKMLEAQVQMRQALALLVVSTLPMLGMCGFIVYKMASEMTPKIKAMFKADLTLPDSVTSFVSFSDHVVGYGLYYIIGVVALGVAVTISLPRWRGTRTAGSSSDWRGQVRHFLDRYVPPYSLYRAYVSSTVTTAIAGMVEADYPMVDAVASVGKTGSPWVRGHTDAMVRGMRTGSMDYGEALVRSGLYPGSVEDQILLVSRSGNVVPLLPVLSERILEQTTKRFKAASVIAGFAVLLAVAAFAMWMMLAMFDLTDAYQQQFESQM